MTFLICLTCQNLWNFPTSVLPSSLAFQPLLIVLSFLTSVLWTSLILVTFLLPALAFSLAFVLPSLQRLASSPVVVASPVLMISMIVSGMWSFPVACTFFQLQPKSSFWRHIANSREKTGPHPSFLVPEYVECHGLRKKWI